MLIQVLHIYHLSNTSKEALVITCLHKEEDLRLEEVLLDKVKWLTLNSLIIFLAFVLKYVW